MRKNHHHRAPVKDLCGTELSWKMNINTDIIFSNVAFALLTKKKISRSPLLLLSKFVNSNCFSQRQLSVVLLEWSLPQPNGT